MVFPFDDILLRSEIFAIKARKAEIVIFWLSKVFFGRRGGGKLLTNLINLGHCGEVW